MTQIPDAPPLNHGRGGYSAGWIDRNLGLMWLQSPNSVRPYWVNVFQGACTCPGFRHWGHCRHTTAGTEPWAVLWTAAGDGLALEDNRTTAEMESDHRQMLDFEADSDPWQMPGRMVA